MIKLILMKKVFEPGDVLFQEGDLGQEAYVIRSGYVTIFKTEGEKRVELATRGPGEIIGEMALIDDRPRSASVAAKNRVEVEIISRGTLKNMMGELPEPVALIIKQLLVRLRDANEMVASLTSGEDR